MEKRWILVSLSMERAYFVEKREIAGRAGNDGKVEPAMTERAEEAAVVLKNVTKYVFHDKNGTS